MAVPSIRIDLSLQELVLEESGNILLRCPVSSGKAGTGHEEGSGKTPTGHFRVCQKIGDGEPEDTIFISRLPAGRYPAAIPESLDEHSDFILTRILWLDGLEPHNANTRSRYIYIHGTNDTDLLGAPASHGCIRLATPNARALFSRVSGAGRGATRIVIGRDSGHVAALSGRRRTAYRLPQERKKTVSCSCRRGFLASLTGSVSQLPFIFARQKPCSGQRAHFGAPFGTHTHAPSSMSACVSSPRLPEFSS